MSRSARIERRLAAKRSYQTVPFLRRSRTLESILATTCVLTLIVLKIASQVGLLSGSDSVGKAMALICLLALLVAALSVLFICTLALRTYPVTQLSRKSIFERRLITGWSKSPKHASDRSDMDHCFA